MEKLNNLFEKSGSFERVTFYSYSRKGPLSEISKRTIKGRIQSLIYSINGAG